MSYIYVMTITIPIKNELHILYAKHHNSNKSELHIFDKYHNSDKKQLHIFNEHHNSNKSELHIFDEYHNSDSWQEACLVGRLKMKIEGKGTLSLTTGRQDKFGKERKN